MVTGTARPAAFLRPAFALVFGAVIVAISTTGCASGSADRTVAPPAPSVSNAAVRVEDSRGPVSERRAAATLRRLDREGGSELLAAHLREVDAVLQSPLVLGNDAHLLVDGPDTEAAMFRAMREAKRSIDLETYILEGEGIGESLATLAADKASEGVAVRIVYDSVGSIATPLEYFDGLRDAGVGVCEFNPVNPTRVRWRTRLHLSINNRDHRKLLIVDGRVAFTGGINISSVYRSSSWARSGSLEPELRNGWRDTHVVVRGPVVTQFQSLFDQTWSEQACPTPEAMDQAEGPTATAPPPRTGPMAARLLAADPAAGSSELYTALLSALDHATDRVWLTYGYFVPDERMLEALRAAATRKVDVRLMLPGFSDFWAPFHAGRSHYASLLSAGVRIFERQGALLHAKAGVIDGVWSTVGSTNLDWRSFVHNYEADLLILDAEFGREMEALFRRDETRSKEILADEWEQRGTRARLLEWLARRLDYLL